MKKNSVHIILLLALSPAAGCIEELYMLLPTDPGSLRIYVVNKSATKFVSPNIGLCPTGLANPPHNFIQTPPVLDPGASVSFTSRQIGGDRGVCTNASPDFMIGLCGWSYGADKANLTRYDKKYGGQIGLQFNCRDTVILRWTDAGPDCGTWTSEVLTAPGNATPTADFQQIDAGGSCTG